MNVKRIHNIHSKLCIPLTFINKFYDWNGYSCRHFVLYAIDLPPSLTANKYSGIYDGQWRDLFIIYTRSDRKKPQKVAKNCRKLQKVAENRKKLQRVDHTGPVIVVRRTHGMIQPEEIHRGKDFNVRR